MVFSVRRHRKTASTGVLIFIHTLIFHPLGTLEKKGRTYFKIQGTYFKICQTYFWGCPERGKTVGNLHPAKVNIYAPRRMDIHSCGFLLCRSFIKFEPAYDLPYFQRKPRRGPGQWRLQLYSSGCRTPYRHRFGRASVLVCPSGRGGTRTRSCLGRKLCVLTACRARCRLCRRCIRSNASDG